MITITSRVEGFRRAGVAHSRNPKSFKDDFFTDGQKKQLIAEPMLIVTKGDADVVLTTTDIPQGGGNTKLSDRTQILARACSHLDKDKSNGKHWTKGGVPQTEALGEISGEVDVTAAERDSAYETYLKIQGE